MIFLSIFLIGHHKGQRKYNYSNSFVATTSNIKFFNIAKMIDDDAWKIIFNL